MINYIDDYLSEVQVIAGKLDGQQIQKMIEILFETKTKGGRVFVLGVGGSAANASHLVNDLRKICGIEAYAPTDNVAELTARTNDDGWRQTFIDWLRVSNLNEKDSLFVLSVGGGDAIKETSINIVNAVSWAKYKRSKVIGIVSRDGGHTKSNADACVLIPVVNDEHITPHAEAFQGVIWHLIVNHPSLQ